MKSGTIFKKLHLYGQDYLFDKVHSKRKVVIEDSKGNRFLLNGLLTKYSDNDINKFEDTFSQNKLYVKFRMSEIINVKSLKNKLISLDLSDIRTVILDGINYNMSKYEINNHTRDYVILEINKVKV